MLYIVADKESKLNIMQAIGEKCGMHSQAKGIMFFCRSTQSSDWNKLKPRALWIPQRTSLTASLTS